MKAPRRVAVTGLGLTGPWGGDVDDFYRRMLTGESAVTRYDTGETHLAISIPAVRCADFDPLTDIGHKVPTLDRSGQFGIAAAQAAWRQAGLPEATSAQRNAGTFWGTALPGAATIERNYHDVFVQQRTRVAPLTLVSAMSNSAASHIAIAHKLGGPCLTYTIACAAATTAIGEGYRRIRDGSLDVAVTGGSDSALSLGTIRAWEAMRVLADGARRGVAAACRPFSTDRGGLVLAEGAGALVLEEWSHAQARGATILAELAGYGCSSDAGHLVRPSQDGQVAAMRGALDDADLSPSDIGYVNAHGTATPEGDPIEIAAIREIFGAHAANLPVSATKSMHGHMMGATGAIEALLCIQALRQGAIPPTAHLDDVSADCMGVLHVRGGALKREIGACLSNSFAFGGSNAVLALRRA
jgi:3-oxoacyl-[acyl-carrier-protein] synthase II